MSSIINVVFPFLKTREIIRGDCKLLNARSSGGFFLFALAEVKALKDQPVKSGHPHQLSETAVPSQRFGCQTDLHKYLKRVFLLIKWSLCDKQNMLERM